MKNLRWTHALCAATFAALLTGCSSLSSRTIEYVGVTHFPPSNPAKVEILKEPPARAHERLGEVVLDISTDPAPAVTKIEARLKDKAARLGADAIVIVQDKAETAGYVVMGPWWSNSYSPVMGRVIVAVAIKYK